MNTSSSFGKAKKYYGTVLLVLLFCFKSYGDTLPLSTILTQLETQYGIFFSYDFEAIKSLQIDFEIEATETPEMALERLLKPNGWTYESFDRKYFVLIKIKEPEIEAGSPIIKRKEELHTLDDKRLFSRELSAVLVDEKTQVPIYNAFVFIRNSSISATSDLSGVFQLDIGTLREVELVITHLNYQTKTIKLNATDNLAQTIFLQGKAVEINEIIVKSKRTNSRKRKAWMKQFKAAFFGKTKNSKGIEFDNPEALWFEEKDKLVKAHAVDYLSIKNTMLGYKLRFYLDTFQMEKRGKVVYAGKVFFEDKLLTSASSKKLKTNRQETYQQSKKYFFRSLWEEKIDEDQYILGLATFDKKGGLASFVPQKLSDLSTKRQGDWFIIYTDQQFAFANKNIVTKWGSGYFMGGEDTYATGYLKPLNGRIIIDSNGVIINANEVEESGYWAKQRIANLLPIEYKIGAEVLVDKATQVKRQLDRVVQQPAEKIYLHIDKPYYAKVDNIRFKGYLVNASNHSNTTPSEVVYVKLLNSKGQIVKSCQLHTKKGLEGSITLANRIPAGTYLVRAYTNYMRNFSVTYFFEKKIQILDEEVIAVKEEVAIASISETEIPKERAAIKVKFYPEGGDLVNNIGVNVAFEAVGVNGNPVAITGKIIDEKGMLIAKIKTTHQGIGLFNLIPKTGQQYKAIIAYDDQSLEFPLPMAQEEGYILKLNNTDAENLYVNVITNKATDLTETFLIGHVRGQVFCLLRGDDLASTLTIPKASIPIGLATFTLFNEVGKPEAERLIFNDFGINQLQLDWKKEANTYQKRSKIDIAITLPPLLKQAVNKHFSVSVTDQSVVRYPVQKNTIQSYLWLNSDLTNIITNPQFYLSDIDKEKRFLLDLLIMTKKWRRFRWKDLAAPMPLTYQPESGYAIKGYTTEIATTTSVPSTVTLTALNQDFYSQSTTTDNAGNFIFKNIPYLDSLNFILQARKIDKKNKDKIDEGKLSGDRVLDIHLITSKDTLPATFNWQKVEKNNPVLADFLKVSNQANLVDSVYNTAWQIDLAEITVKATKPFDSRLFDTYNFNQIDWISPQTRGIHLLAKLKPSYNFIIEAGTGKIIRLTRNLRGEPLRVEMNLYVNGVQANSARFSTTPVDFIDYLYVGESVISMITRPSGSRSLQAKMEQGILNVSHPGYHQARIFYAPNYATPSVNHEKPDFRTTIHWDADLIFNEAGNAQLSFYAADSPGIYEIRLMGIAENLPIYGQYEVAIE